MNVFENVVRNEVQFTELFRNLCEYKIFRSIISEWIYTALSDHTKHKSIDESSFDFKAEDIQTQVSMDLSGDSDNNRSRPDLTIDTGVSQLMLELKVDPYCDLTDNQPGSYLSLLQEDKQEDKSATHKALLFIVPKYYQHQNEILDRVNAWRKKEELSKESKNGPILFSILYWEDLSSLIRSKGLYEVNDVFRQFVDFIAGWFPYERITLSKKDIDVLHSREAGEAVQKAHDLVDQMREILKAYSLLKLTPKRAHQYDYSVTARFEDGEPAGYFGFAYYGWAEQDGFPFLIGVPGKRKEAIDDDRLVFQYQEDELFYFSISKTVFRSESVLSDMIDLFFRAIGIEKTSEIPSVDFPISETDIAIWFHNNYVGETFNKVVDALMQVRQILQSRENMNIQIRSSINEYSVVVDREDTGFYMGLFLWNWKDDGIALWAGLPEEQASKIETSSFFGKERFPEDEWIFHPIHISTPEAQNNLVDYLLDTATELLYSGAEET